MSEVGLFKIFLFPDKLKKILSVSPDNIDDTYPIVVELSLTDKCNLSCVWCSDRAIRKDRPGTLSKEVLFKLFKDLKEGGIKGLTIEGGGEPSIHPDFIDIVKCAKDCGLSIGLITNGVEEKIIECADSFDWIRVSLDASTQEEYLNIKHKDKFEVVMKNIEGFSGKCDVVGIGFIVTNSNCSQLLKLVKRVKSVGANYIHFRPVVDCPEMVSDIDLFDIVEFKGNGFDVMIDAMSENMVRGNGGVSCVAHSLHSIINSDGSVFICGRLNMYSWWPPIGNINESLFRDIWNSDLRISQNCVLSGDASFCRIYCPQCRITKYNIELNQSIKAKTKNFI